MTILATATATATATALAATGPGPEVSIVGVAASTILILIAAAISVRERLGLERSIVWAATRAAVQLLAIGSLLGLVLADDAPIVWAWAWVAAMILIGGIVVSRRVPEVPGLLALSCGAIAVAVAASLAVVFGFGMYELSARTLVPTAGMLMGNGIGSTVLAARRTATAIDEHRDQVEVRLSLGQTGAAAVLPHLRDALVTANTPQIEQTKIVGLIALPGTMTGLLLAGVDPVDAVLVQLAVMFLILGSVAITSVIVGRGVARRMITPDQRLIRLPSTGAHAGPGR